MDRTSLCKFLQISDDLHRRIVMLESACETGFLGPKYESASGAKHDKKDATRESKPVSGSPSKPFEVDYGDSEHVLDEKGTIDVVSYNILSLELGMDDNYRNIDGSVNTIDVGERRTAINDKIIPWLAQGKVLCLQEVTYKFIGQEENSYLHDKLRLYNYAIYSHFYSYVTPKTPGQKGFCTLGLAVLVPRRLYAVKNSGILRPWENPEVPKDIASSVDAARLDMSIIEIAFGYCSVIFKRGSTIGVQDAVILLQEGIKKLKKELSTLNTSLPVSIVSHEAVRANKLIESVDMLNNIVKSAAGYDISRLKSLLQELIIHTCNIQVQPSSSDDFNIMKALSDKKAELSKLCIKQLAPFKSSTHRYSDRVAIILQIEDKKKNNLLLTTVHLPCQYRYPAVMTSIAFKTKESILQWMKRNTTGYEYPMLLCGDFNSDPNDEAQGAYHSFTGDLSYHSQHVQRGFIHESDFYRIVNDEKWTDCLKNINEYGCTNFGFTGSRFNECKTELKASMDSIRTNLSVLVDRIIELRGTADSTTLSEMCDRYIEAMKGGNDEKMDYDTERELRIDLKKSINEALRERNRIFKPNPHLIDHFFMRDRLGRVEITHRECPQVYDVIGKTKGRPLPDLSLKEPSDHLYISLSLRFKVPDLLRRTRSTPNFMADEYED